MPDLYLVEVAGIEPACYVKNSCNNGYLKKLELFTM